MSLPSFKRYRKTDQIVLHESGGADTIDATLSVLKARRCGVHVLIGTDGERRDVLPLDVYTSHAGINARPPKGNLHNRRSVAIEAPGPYYCGRPVKGADKRWTLKPWTDAEAAAWEARGGVVIRTGVVWAHLGSYAFPPAIQLEGVWSAIVDVRQKVPTIPETFVGVDAGAFVWGAVSRHDISGIAAHAHWNHADGLAFEFYAILRARGYGATDAYRLTLEATRSGKRRTPVPSEVDA